MKIFVIVLVACIVLVEAVTVGNLSMMEKCPICNKTLQNGSPTVRLREKRCNSVNIASKERKLTVCVVPGQEVHMDVVETLFIPGTGDADSLIVETALESAETSVTYVIGEDTDLLILLCLHTKEDSKKVYFRSGIKKSTAKPNKIWDIHNTQKVLTRKVCDLLPFVHALTGCDTTSHIYGIGKSTALRLLRTNLEFQETARQFMVDDSKADIVKYGEKAIIILLDGDTSVNLDVLRFRKFATKVMASTTCVQVHTLPSTSAAAAFHSMRVYFQCQSWIGNLSLKPEDWGWELTEGMYIPVKTDLPPAPDSLLNVVRCICKTNCDSKRCTCRKHGLICSVGCGACRGVNCSNSHTLADIEIEENMLDCIG